MKICLIANPRSVLIKRWVEYYISQNHEIHVIYFDSLKSIKEKISIPGCRIHKVMFFSYLLLDLQLPLNYLQLLRLLKKIKPDILHAHYLSYHAWLGALAGFHPLIVTAWGSDIYIEAQKSKKIRQWVSHTFEKADLITTTSKSLKKYLMKNYKIESKKIIRFYWGQDLEIFKKDYDNEIMKLRKKYNLGKNIFIVLSNRNMKPLYGIDYIIRCIPDVIKKEKNVKFIFLRGSGFKDYEKQLKSLVKELKVEKYTIFIAEFLSQKEFAVINNLADVVISLPVSDQISGAVKEAMACGAIPILQDLECYHEQIEDRKHGYYVDREKSKEVAKRIIYCINHHPELKQRFAKTNRKMLEKESDWNKNKKLMLKLYSKVLKDRLKSN